MVTAVFSRLKTDWETPAELFTRLDVKYNFTLDPCATHENAKCSKYFTKDQDGLSQPWCPERVWLNPPYGRDIGQWMKKAAEERTLVVALLPARTDTKWFHAWVLPFAKSITFVRGRLRFVGANSSAPFPSILVKYQPMPAVSSEIDII